jgi:hypothetical protein
MELAEYSGDGAAVQALVELEKVQARYWQARGDDAQARQAIIRWRVQAHSALAVHPENFGLRLCAAAAVQRLAQASRAEDDFAAAADLFGQAAQTCFEGLAFTPGSRQLHRRIAALRAAQAECLLKARDASAARQALEDAIRHYGGAQLHHQDPRTAWLSYARCQNSLARLYESETRPDDAARLYLASLETLEQVELRLSGHPHHATLSKNSRIALERLGESAGE